MCSGEHGRSTKNSIKCQEALQVGLPCPHLPSEVFGRPPRSMGFVIGMLLHNVSTRFV